MKAFHFLREDRTSANGGEPPWTLGEERTWPGELLMCHRGYHSSPTPCQAASYAVGFLGCIVDTDRDLCDDDKFCSHRRRLMAWGDTRHIFDAHGRRLLHAILAILGDVPEPVRWLVENPRAELNPWMRDMFLWVAGRSYSSKQAACYSVAAMLVDLRHPYSLLAGYEYAGVLLTLSTLRVLRDDLNADLESDITLRGDRTLDFFQWRSAQ